MLLLLAACRVESPKPGAAADTAAPDSGEVRDSDTVDSAVDTDSAVGTDTDTGGGDSADSGPPVDTGPCAGADEAEVPECTLSAPGAVDGASLDTLRALVWQALFPHLDQLGDDASCPALTLDGATEVWTGGCSTADGRVYGGVARIDPWVRFEWSSTTFSAFTEEAADGSHAYAADGYRRAYSVDEGTWLEVDLTRSIRGSDDADLPDGDLVLRGEFGAINQYETATLYLEADGNDWCLAIDRSWWSWSTECPEADGWAVVVGARTARYVERGWDDGCDACICFAPEDAAEELYCRE